MGLIVESITLEGFGSYAGKQTVRLGGNGPVAVVGENGAGKSTAVSKALTWCLYGKCPPERMGSGTRAITGKAVIGTTQDSATVTVVLKNSESSALFHVERHRTKKSETLKITKESDRQVETLPDEQATIDAIIGADWEVFTKTVVRGQGDLWSFSEATDKRKREILDAISGADELEAHWEKVKIERRKAEKSQSEFTRKVVYLEESLERIERAIKQEQDNATAWAARTHTKIAAAEADVAAMEKAVQDAAKADALIGDNIKAREKLQKEQPALDRKAYTDAVDAAREAHTDAVADHRHKSAVAHSLMGLSIGDPCPTCTQQIGPNVLNKAAAAAAEAKQAHDRTSDTRKHLTNCEEVMSTAEAWLASEVNAWAARMASIPVMSEQLPAAERALKQQKRIVEDLKSAENPHVYALEKAEAERATLRREVAIAKAAAESATINVEAAKAWDLALSPKGARAQLATAALLAIETNANQWLSVLSDKGMSIDFPATKEVKGRLKEEIQTIVRTRDENGDEVIRDLLTYSGGERRRVNLAVDLGVAAAFNKGNGLAVSLLVLDEEVFSGLDEAGKAAVVTALHGAGIDDIVIIDHDPRLSSVLPRTLEVSRNADGYSEIKEENHT